MKKFSTYLEEEKLKHLEHLEDALFNTGYGGAEDALRMLEEIVDSLQGSTSSSINIQSKVDGAPSIIAGTNPENGKFFVATKSLFNKTAKINYTDADVDTNHSGDLATKMKIALKQFPKLNIDGIIQGDFMFVPSDLKKVTIDGEPMISFTPNTITYAVPVDQPLAKQISSAKVGVIWHTSYTGDTIADLSAVFSVNVGALTKTKDVWAGDTDFKDVSGTATLTKTELSKVKGDIDKARKSLKQLSRYGMKVLFSDQKEDTIAFNVKIYINDMVSTGKKFTNKQKAIGSFIDFIRARYQAKADKVKTEKSKAKKLAKAEAMVKTLNSDRKIGGTFAYALEWHNNVADIKLALIKKMEQVNSIPAFMATSTGYKVTGPEGFVAVDHMSNKAIKLVNRMEFSRNNFNAIKSWSK